MVEVEKYAPTYNMLIGMPALIVHYSCSSSMLLS